MSLSKRGVRNYFGVTHRGNTYLPLPLSQSIVYMFSKENTLSADIVLIRDQWPCCTHLNKHYRLNEYEYGRYFDASRRWEELTYGRTPLLSGWEANGDTLVFRHMGAHHEWKIQHSGGKIQNISPVALPYEVPLDPDYLLTLEKQQGTDLLLPIAEWKAFITRSNARWAAIHRYTMKRVSVNLTISFT